jgi:hypothetical protein
MFRRRPTTRDTNRREFAYSFQLIFAEGFRSATRPAESDQWIESSLLSLKRNLHPPPLIRSRQAYPQLGDKSCPRYD